MQNKNVTFDRFLNFFGETIDYSRDINAYTAFVTGFEGRTFGGGLFRCFDTSKLEEWHNTVDEAFPSFSGKYKLFGYDWLGRCFSLDVRNPQHEAILLMDIGMANIYKIPINFCDFMNFEVVDKTSECFAEHTFQAWKKRHSEVLEKQNCIGYKVPPFLGGEINIDNMEKCDMEVYWNVLTQINNQVHNRNLPEGTRFDIV